MNPSFPLPDSALLYRDPAVKGPVQHPGRTAFNLFELSELHVDQYERDTIVVQSVDAQTERSMARDVRDMKIGGTILGSSGQVIDVEALPAAPRAAQPAKTPEPRVPADAILFRGEGLEGRPGRVVFDLFELASVMSGYHDYNKVVVQAKSPEREREMAQSIRDASIGATIFASTGEVIDVEAKPAATVAPRAAAAQLRNREDRGGWQRFGDLTMD